MSCSASARPLRRALCTYLGGGTHLDPEMILSLQGPREPPADIFLITDMQIANLEPVIDYMERCPNRITAVHTGENLHTARFRRRVDLRPNVCIFSVTSTADIPRIVIGRVKDYLYSRSAGASETGRSGTSGPAPGRCTDSTEGTACR